MNDESASLPASYGEIARIMFTHAGVLTAFALMILCLVLRSLVGWQLLDVAVFVVLVLIRGLFEWFLHARIWHAGPIRIAGKRYVNPIAAMHTRHHLQPHDVNGLLFGGISVLGVFVLMMLGFGLLFRSYSLAITLSFSFLVLLVIHEWFHMVAHSRIQHLPPLIRRAVQNHRLHHYRDGSKWMGVSSVLGDRLFNSFGREEMPSRHPGQQ